MYLRGHYDRLFDSLEKLGEFEQAEEAVRRGLEIARKLAADFPETVRYRDLVAASLYNLGNRLRKSQRFGEAQTAYREALEIYTQLSRDAPDVPQYGNDVADTYRQLGVTYFRAGKWRAAADALEKAAELRGDDAGANEWFYLAMTRWRLGDKEQARELYDRAVEWMDKNKPEDEKLRHLRTEAAELLDIED
jgi:tetratricopeptide (TPR) repeat protein